MNKIKVLLVDDEPYIRQGLSVLIDWESYGFCICAQAADGQEAWEYLQGNPIDLVIADIKMPRMDGLQLADNISRDEKLKTKVIILSGYYEFGFAQAAIRYGVVDYVLKPLKKSDLIAVLQTFKSDYDIVQSPSFGEKRPPETYGTALEQGRFSDKDISSVEKLPFGEKDNISCGIILAKTVQEETEDYESSMTDKITGMLNSVIEPDNGVVLGSFRSEEYAEFIEIGFVAVQDRVPGLIKGFSDMAKNLKMEFWLLFGETVRGVSRLNHSFKSLEAVRMMHGLTGRKSPIFSDKDIEEYNNKHYFLMPEHSDKLAYAIRRGSEEEIEKSVSDIYKDMLDNKAHYSCVNNTLQYLFYKCAATAKSRLGEHAPNPAVAGDTLTRYGDAKLLKRFAYELAGASQAETGTTDSVLRSIEADIHQNYSESLSLKSLGEKYFINSVYLGQIFKKKYGVAFKDFLNSYRIEKAAQLLLISNDRVYEVANAVGYNNTDYFISRFVKQMGTTPYQYRVLNYEKEE